MLKSRNDLAPNPFADMVKFARMPIAVLFGLSITSNILMLTGSVFMLLQACLGITLDGWTGQIEVEHPRLPIGIDSLRLDGLRMGGHYVDLLFQHAGERVIAVPGRRSDPTVALITRS